MTHPLHTRSYPLQLRTRDDGRTVVGRVVPYGETVEFDDGNGHAGKERFVRGALARMVPAWHRVGLFFTHNDVFPNAIGRGQDLEERDDGAYATFRLYPAVAALARDILEDTHKGLSLAFYSLRDHLDDAGVHVRTRVAVEHVAAVVDPAYSGAGILAIRAATADRHAVGPDDTARTVLGAQRGLQPAATPRLDAALADLAELTASPEHRRQIADLRARGGTS